MIYKTIIITKSFEAGMKLGKLSSFLAANEAGKICSVSDFGSSDVAVEVAANHHLIMSYIEDELAAYV